MLTFLDAQNNIFHLTGDFGIISSNTHLEDHARPSFPSGCLLCKRALIFLPVSLSSPQTGQSLDLPSSSLVLSLCELGPNAILVSVIIFLISRISTWLFCK